MFVPWSFNPFSKDGGRFDELPSMDHFSGGSEVIGLYESTLCRKIKNKRFLVERLGENVILV